MIGRAFGGILQNCAERRYRRLAKHYSHPETLQEKNLRIILKKARDTAFGREFGFRGIQSVLEYQRRVPLTSYEKMKPWLDACREGKPDQIWPGIIQYFALTSGTTSGKSKYIPVSEDMMRENRRAGLDCLFFYLVNTKDISLFDGKLLLLGGSTSLEKLPHGFSAGDMSGIMSKKLPFYIRGHVEPGSDLALIPDWEERIIKIVDDIKEKDIRLVSGIPSWLLVFFDYLLERTGQARVCDIWDNLSLLIYGGLDFSPYAQLMRDIIGKDVYCMETYFASEAFVGIQDTPSYCCGGINEAGLLLMLDYGTFYEFVRPEDVEKNNPRRYTVSEIELDRNYAIAVTNQGGLYSYIIGDTVKFLSKDPFRIKVTGRTGNFISALGEHVITEEVEYAISEASLKTGALITNYTVAPRYPGNKRERPGHQWLIEFSKRPDDMDLFIRILDEALCLKNDDYSAHRIRNIGMAPPSVYELNEGTFYRWHRERNMLGGQHKTPRLRNNRIMAEELIKLDKAP